MSLKWNNENKNENELTSNSRSVYYKNKKEKCVLHLRIRGCDNSSM